MHYLMLIQRLTQINQQFQLLKGAARTVARGCDANFSSQDVQVLLLHRNILGSLYEQTS